MSLRELIAEVVCDHLAEWGQVAYVHRPQDELNPLVRLRDGQPLRDIMNSTCQPLIDELCQQIEAYQKEPSQEANP